MNSGLSATKNKKQGFRPGLCIKNGKLYAFSEVRVIVVRGWPEMSAWTKSCGRPRWTRFRPEIDFREGIVSAYRSRHRFRSGQLIEHIPENEAAVNSLNVGVPSDSEANKSREAFEQEKQLVRAYFGNVPAVVQNAIQLFLNRQWHLHVMAARCAGALDLIASNPALAYGLASGWVFANSPSKYVTRQMRRLIAGRRRKICGALGFPNEESSVAVLSKISASSCNIPWLLTIRDLLSDLDWRKSLLHLPSLNSAVMLFLCNRIFRQRTSLQLLYELSCNPSYLFKQMIVLLSLEKNLGKRGPERFHSVRQLLDHLLELLWKANVREVSDETDGSFPNPPIPGNGNIVPLKNSDLLFEEGKEQDNCVANYRPSIFAGKMYIYRVLQPERATLSLVPCESGGWRIDQLLAAHNGLVYDATRKAVEHWIRRAQKRQSFPEQQA